MAEEEEDFSSLPFSDRFAHKVGLHTSHNYMPTETFLELESQEEWLRGRGQSVRDHAR